jgi:LemA protein
MSTGLIIGIVSGVVIILYILLAYNSLIRLKNEAENSWSQIDVQLKRRSDLIPNLVDTVKGYMKHEKETLENITKARSAIMNAESVQETANASNMLTGALKSLFAVSENYPDLKASQNFIQLQEEISGTENKISYARQHYNDMVMMYRNKMETIPTNIIASLFNFKDKDLFEATTEEKKNIKVNF